MKKRKFLVCLLCLELLLATVAFAANYGRIRLSADKTELARGEEFDVAVEMTRNPGIAVLRLRVEFSSEQLELVQAEDEKLLPGALFSDSIPADSYALYWSAGADSTATGHLARLRFRVKEKAKVGECTVALSLNAWDSTDADGRRVGFDLEPLELTIPCRHEEMETEIIKEVSFAETGLAKDVCPDCGEEWERVLLPTIESRDGKASAVVTPGEFSAAAAEPTFTVQYLFSGEEYDRAKEAFGEKFYRVFRLHFTREGLGYVPKEPVTIRLEAPETGLALYVPGEAGFEKVDYEKDEEVFGFSYLDSCFVLIRAEKTEAPPETEEPGVTDPAASEPPAPSEAEEPETLFDWRYLAVGGAILAVCGGGIVFFLIRSKRRDL